MEHRCGRRISLDLAVQLGFCGGLVDGQLTNVSLSGAYVRTNAPIPPLTPTYLELNAACPSGAVARPIHAWIIRVDAGGVGLEWAEFSPPAIRALLDGQTAHTATRDRVESAAPIERKVAGR